MKRNWTEPRAYTDPEGHPIRLCIFSKDDARLVAELHLSRDDDPETIAQARADFAAIAGLPEMVKELKRISFAKPDRLDHSLDAEIIERAAKIARAALAKAGL